MSKQGIIVVSHPRSGSSEFIRVLAHFAAKTLSPNKPVGILAECFHWADATTFGNFPRVHILSRDNNLEFPHEEMVLEPKVSLPDFRSSDNVLWQGHFYQPTTKLFTCREDVNRYYIDQYQKRIGYVNETVTAKSFPIVKSFVGFTNFHNDQGQLLDLQQSLVPSLTNIEPIFFYRKNLVDTIYSDLIKWLYLDQPKINGQEELDGFTGHNFNNTMPPLIPKPGMIIDEVRARHYPELFCETLKNYQMNQHFFKNVISYDQVFVDKKFNLHWGNDVHEVTDHSNSDREYPMNYQAPKRDYFENPNMVIDAIDQVITRYDLWEVVDELGIITK